ncbi:tyrosine-type recombinase/integrase [Streptomyces sp. JHA26]|uniref:tyrosine-type recombinase/integrase n=1 Tax=Streptomyces sp. JHA26 TaxID=1917143 RepID=UPI0035D10AC8
MSFGEPKTKTGKGRVIELGDNVVGALLAHQLRQQAERKERGDAYADHGLVFAKEDGDPLRPDEATRLFADLVDETGLRRVRLHDLRHGYASLLLAGGVQLETVSKMPGHSGIQITSKVHAHPLPGEARKGTEKAAALIPRARKTPADTGDHSVTTPGIKRPRNPGPIAPPQVRRHLRGGSVVGRVGLEPTADGL